MQIIKTPWSVQVFNSKEEVSTTIKCMSAEKLIAFIELFSGTIDGNLYNSNTKSNYCMELMPEEYQEFILRNTFSEEQLIWNREHIASKFHAFTQDSYHALHFRDICKDSSGKIYTSSCIIPYHEMFILTADSLEEMKLLLKDCNIRTLWIQPPLSKDNPITPIIFQPYGI